MTTISDLLTIFDSNLYTEFLEKYSEIVTPELETDNLITARGISFLRTGQPAEAVKYFELLLQKNPNNKESRLYHTSAGNVWMQDCLERGNDLLTSGKMQEAYESYSQIKLNDYENLNKNLVFQLCNNLAVCLLNLGRAAEALDAFNSSHLTSSLEDDTSPLSEKRRADTALNKAIILKSLQRHEEALAEFEQCLASQTDNLTAICGKAEILSSLRRFDEAVEMTTAAIDAHPLDEQMASTDLPKVTQILSLWVARGFASIKLNEFANAMKDFNFVIQLSSQPPYLTLIPRSETSLTEAYRLRNICLSYYGDHLLSAGDILKAIEVYDEAIEVAGGEDMVPTVSVLFNRAYGYYQLSPGSPEYLDKAIEGFQAVVKRDPNHFQGQTGLGQALLNKADAMVAQGDDDLSVIQEPVFLAAIESLKQAHRIDPSDTQIIYNLALTLLRTTQAEAAATKFRLLLSITPDSENAVKGLELCEQMILDQSRIEAMKKRRAEAQKVATPAAVPSSPPKPSPTPSPSKTTSHPSPAPSPTAATSPAVATSPPVAVSAVATGAPKAAAPVSSSEPKSESGVRDLLSQIRETSFYFPHDALKAPGPYPDGINSAHRELYLVDEDFKKLLGVGSKEEFLAFPQWKQVSKKKAAGLF